MRNIDTAAGVDVDTIGQVHRSLTGALRGLYPQSIHYFRFNNAFLRAFQPLAQAEDLLPRVGGNACPKQRLGLPSEPQIF